MERWMDRCSGLLGHLQTESLLLDRMVPSKRASPSRPAALLAALALLLLPAATCGQCSKPEQISFAHLLNNTELEVFPPGTTLKYQCRPGYYKRSFFLSCLPNSAWTLPPDMICKKKSCPVPQDVQNGRVEISSLEFGAVINYTCNEGYRLIGESSAFCLISDSKLMWDQDPPICDAIPCETPPTIANGRTTQPILPIYFYGMVVTYECENNRRSRPQFKLVGNKSIYCTSRDNRVGVWSGPAPQCIPHDACTPPVVENGLWEPTDKSLFNLGETVQLRCQPGFELKGPHRVWCRLKNKWEPALPFCFRRCPSPPEILHGSHTETQRDHFNPGEQVSYTCQPGYWLDGAASLHCKPQGTWSPEPPRCRGRPCTAFLDQPRHGRVHLPQSFQPGARVTFECNEGYHLQGSFARHCVLVGGQSLWNGSTPECEKIFCPPPPPILNGRHSAGSLTNVAFGEEVTYTCDPPPDPHMTFDLIGEGTLRCGSNNQGQGVWSGRAPHCELKIAVKSCAVPPRPLNGRAWTGSGTQVGSAVHYSCDKGYRLTGSPSATCVLSGQSATWDMETPHCVEIFCPPPPPIHNGSHSAGSLQSIPYGKEVTYACDPHPDPHMTFDLIGQSTIRCGSDSQGQGVWIGSAPRCKLAGTQVCPPPPKILHGHITGGHAFQYHPGMFISYSCDPGYVPVDGTFLYCTYQGTWSATSQVCREVICHLPHLVHGIWKESKAQTVFHYKDNVTVQCALGHRLEGSPWSQCQANGTWAPPLAMCMAGAWPAILTSSLTAGILFILLLVTSCWLSRRFRRGNNSGKKCEEVSVYLHPQEDTVCVHALSLQPTQKNTRCTPGPA